MGLRIWSVLVVVSLLVTAGCVGRSGRAYNLRPREVACEFRYGENPVHVFGPMKPGEVEELSDDGAPTYTARVAVTSDSLVFRFEQEKSNQTMTVALSDLEGDSIEWTGDWIDAANPAYRMTCWGG